MDINAEKCLSNGSNPGLGYRADEERRFHIDLEGAAVVREIFEQYASGKTVTEIIQSLNARQIKTSQGKAFNKNSLHRLLRNKRYIGYYIYKGTETPGGMPRIIEDELNVAVGQQLAAFQYHMILDFLFADDLLFAFAAFEIVAGIIVIRLARFARAAVTGHHLPTIAAK